MWRLLLRKLLKILIRILLVLYVLSYVCNLTRLEIAYPHYGQFAQMERRVWPGVALGAIAAWASAASAKATRKAIAAVWNVLDRLLDLRQREMVNA